MPTIPESHKDLLEGQTFAHVATIGPNGEPQNNPVWVEFDGRNIKFSQTKGRQKYRNVQREPRVSLSITDPKNPYRYLEVRGKVARIEDDSSNAFIDKMAKKYLGQEQYPWHQPGDQRVVVVVEPEHTSQMG
jgi:hypothetical protein